MVIGWSCVTLLSTALATTPVDIRGTGQCPSSAEVAQRVVELLPAMAANHSPDLVQLNAEEPGGGSVTITLRRADGTLLAQKKLLRAAPRGSRDLGATCADLAAAAALIIATWESDVHPEFQLDVASRPRVDRQSDRPAEVPRPGARETEPSRSHLVVVPRQVAPVPVTPLPFRPAPDTTAVLGNGVHPPRFAAETGGEMRLPSSASAAAGGVAPALPVAPTTVPPPPIRSPVPAVVTAAPAPRVNSVALVAPVVDVGLAAVGMLSPSDHGVAGGGALGAGFTSRHGWGAHLALLATTERTTSLPAGQVNWRRVMVTLGPQRRWEFNNGRLNLDVHADGFAALLSLRGTGFTSNDSDRAVDPGVGGGVRLSMGRGRWRPWVEVSSMGWLLRRVAYESPDNGAHALPRFETALAVGVSSWSRL